MSANFYELLKYAATGIASPDMTYYDRMRASTLMGGVVQTLTGIPPLSFKADGTPLISLSMKGNGSQTGTPTHDNPVMPTFCGVGTGNLWDEDYTGISGDLKYAPVYVGDGSFTLSTDTPDYSGNAPLFLLSGNVTSGASTPVNGVYNGVSRTAVSSNGYITIAFRRQPEPANPATHKAMLNSGSTALPYEPFGYKIPITCGGQTVPVYLGQVSTVRKIRKFVITGNENISSVTSQGVLVFLIMLPRNSMYHSSANGVICDRYISKYANQNGAIYQTNNQNGQIAITDNRFADRDEFKTYLQQQYAAGTPVTVWYILATPETATVNEPLAKIGTYADELSSTDAGVTIPTVKGQNTLTVDTPIQPSEMTITYKG